MSTANSGTELAKERNRAAQERTLMAWIRTALSLISFGFGIDSIVTILNRELGGVLNPLRSSRVIGLGFVTLGTLAMLYAALEHRQQLLRIQRGYLNYVPRISSTLIVAYGIALFGGVAIFSILFGPALSK